MTPMTGLDLESFLHLLRADLGAWLSVGAVALLLALMTWTSWGSRRALRKCLGLSIAVHGGLILYWFLHPNLLLALQPDGAEPRHVGIRQIQVTPVADRPDAPAGPSVEGLARRRLAAWDRPAESLALADRPLRAPRFASAAPEPERADAPGPELAAAEVSPPEPAAPEARPVPAQVEEPIPAPVAQPGPEEVAKADPAPPAPAEPIPPAGNERLRLTRPEPAPSRPGVQRARPEQPALPEALALAAEARPIAPGPRLEPPADSEVAAGPAPEPARADEPGMPRAAAGSPEPAAPLPGDADLRRRPRRPSIRPDAPGPAPAPAPRGPIGLGSGGGPDAPALALATPGARPIESPGREPDGPAAPADGTIAPEPRRPAPVAPDPARPEADVRKRSRPNPAAAHRGPVEAPGRLAEAPGPIAMASVVPPGSPRLPEIRGAVGGRPLADVPEIYRSRLDPNRSILAQRAGATPASEQAVERALDWLMKHQDADGGWDGRTARQADGTPIPGDDDFTVHCPPGDLCPGECFYWEADTALTGLALLAYLGAGYTHTDGVYADTVAKGLEYLINAQKPDGDLRGKSKAVGMYCHAMAALALCEAYALTADQRLRGPAERAAGFLVKAQAPNGLGWRYGPRPPMGDTSILGWAVLVLKSAKYAGIAVPRAAESGATAWLDRVTDGDSGGLARYQPTKAPSETMTAEAWVCRLFLGSGGRGPDGAEAASYLMAHRPDRGAYNIYYWYYGTLAMYLHGGPDWPRWNVQVREELVRRQKTKGHQTGSWDPDESTDGSRGGRLYATALSALTLEVYYRYLPLYNDSATPPVLAPAPERPGDPTLRRAAGESARGRGWRKKE